MPIYEYTCQDCGKHFEALRSIKDADSPISCKHCESRQTRRQISVCYAQSGGKVIAGGGHSCGGCAGGSCASCGH